MLKERFLLLNIKMNYSRVKIAAKARQWYNTNDIEFLESLTDEGVEVTFPERGPFREASRNVYQIWADKVGGMDIINRILNYDYRKKKFWRYCTGSRKVRLVSLN